MTFEGTFILIWQVSNRVAGRPEPKTKEWWVTPKDKSGLLGKIKWFGRWRKYCFFPEPDCVFEEICLGEIAEFIKARTREHKIGGNPSPVSGPEHQQGNAA